MFGKTDSKSEPVLKAVRVNLCCKGLNGIIVVIATCRCRKVGKKVNLEMKCSNGRGGTFGSSLFLSYQTQTTGSNLALRIITANDHSRLPRECTRLIAVDLFGREMVALLGMVSGAVAHNPLPCMAEARFLWHSPRVICPTRLSRSANNRPGLTGPVSFFTHLATHLSDKSTSN